MALATPHSSSLPFTPSPLLVRPLLRPAAKSPTLQDLRRDPTHWQRAADAVAIAEYTAQAAPPADPELVWVRPDAAPYLRFRAAPWGQPLAQLQPGAGPFAVVGRDGDWLRLAGYAHADYLTTQPPDET